MQTQYKTDTCLICFLNFDEKALDIEAGYDDDKDCHFVMYIKKR